MEETGEKRSSFYLFQNISIAIQRGNASCVLGTIPHSEGLEEIFDFVTYGDDSERSDGFLLLKTDFGILQSLRRSLIILVGLMMT